MNLLEIVPKVTQEYKQRVQEREFKDSPHFLSCSPSSLQGCNIDGSEIQCQGRRMRED